MITASVAIMDSVFCTQTSSIRPSVRGKRAVICWASTLITGALMPDSRMKTNFTTTQVNQTGSRVSRPVRKSFCSEGCAGGVELGMAGIVGR